MVYDIAYLRRWLNDIPIDLTVTGASVPQSTYPDCGYLVYLRKYLGE